MNSEIIECPLCQHHLTNAPVSIYGLEAAAEHFAPINRNPERYQRLKNTIQGIWGGRSSAFFYRCPACDFGFGFPHQGGNEAFYGILHESPGYPTWRWEYEVGYAAQKNYTANSAILDIGTGDGQFLLPIQDPKWQRYATENSDTNREKLRQQGIQIIEHEHFDEWESRFDVVTMFQVLEHIAEFKTVLNSTYGILKKGGRVVVSVPDCENMTVQETLIGYADMVPNHINKWSPKSLAMAMAEAGFAIEAVVPEKAGFKNFLDNLQYKLRAVATQKGSLAQQIYAIENKKLRILGLASISLYYALGLLPHLSYCLKGKTFAIVGKK